MHDLLDARPSTSDATLTCSADSRSWSCVWQRTPASYLVPAEQLHTCRGLATPNSQEEVYHGQALVPGGDCSVADRFHGRCNSRTNYSGVWTFQPRFCAARKIEDYPELLFDVLLLFNPLFQSPAIGARHDGTNTSHYFATYDFVSHLPDKFRALSTEILVWWGGRKMGRHGEG